MPSLKSAETIVKQRESSSAPSAYYPSVDVLRGFAALSVLIYHVIETWNWEEFPHEGALAWFRVGWLGVDLFFVISGFVIGLSAFSGVDRYGPSGFRAPFWRRRLARIVPLHYLTCVLFVVLLVPLPWAANFGFNAMAHALFVHNLFPSVQGALNAPNWSLGIEMQFYLLVMIIAPWLQGRRGLFIVLGMFVTAWIWRYAWFHALSPLPPGGEKDLWLATVQLPGTLDEFAAGLLLAIVLRSDRGREVPAVLAKRRMLLLLTGIGAGVLIWSAFLIYWAGPSFWQSATTVTTVRTPLALAATVMLLIACSLNSDRWLQWSAPFRYLGVISYGIYLWHWLVLLLLQKAGIANPLVGLVLTIAITLTLSVCSWHLLEKPIIKVFGYSSHAGD